MFAALAVVFVVASYAASRLVAPRRPSAAKSAPYECGIVPTRESAERFPVRFYLVAMVFIVFDIEIIFLYPWAVRFEQLGAFGLAEMAVFTGVVFVCIAYLMSNGVLNWGPRSRRDYSTSSPMNSIRYVEKPARTLPNSDVENEGVQRGS